MDHAWLVRPFIAGDKKNYTEDFLDKGYIAIGPNNLPNLTQCSVEKIKKLIGDRFAQEKLAVGAHTAIVNNFVNKMQKNDLALIISEQSIYAAEILSDYSFIQVKFIGQNILCHRRAIKVLHGYTRDELSPQLRLALKSGRQIADISKYYTEVYKLCYGEECAAAESNCKPVSVAYPLRPDFTIEFSVPSDMTQEEAQRLEAFIKTLYFK